MNKALFIFIILLAIAPLHSCKKCGYDTLTPPTIADCIFKTGSYFIYNDSIDHIIDSQYVYQYNYEPGQGVGGYVVDPCSAGYDLLDMYESSFHNGLFYDNFVTNTDPSSLYLSDSLGFYYYGGIVFTLSSDTPALKNFNVSGTVYPTVYKNNYLLTIIENAQTVPTDLYYAPNYGLIKRVEHRPTGDISWNLIRYHIVH